MAKISRWQRKTGTRRAQCQAKKDGKDAGGGAQINQAHRNEEKLCSPPTPFRFLYHFWNSFDHNFMIALHCCPGHSMSRHTQRCNRRPHSRSESWLSILSCRRPFLLGIVIVRGLSIRRHRSDALIASCSATILIWHSQLTCVATVFDDDFFSVIPWAKHVCRHQNLSWDVAEKKHGNPYLKQVRHCMQSEWSVNMLRPRYEKVDLLADSLLPTLVFVVALGTLQPPLTKLGSCVGAVSIPENHARNECELHQQQFVLILATVDVSLSLGSLFTRVPRDVRHLCEVHLQQSHEPPIAYRLIQLHFLLPESLIGVPEQVMREGSSSSCGCAVRLSMKRSSDSSNSESETKRLDTDHSTRDVVMLLDDSDVSHAVERCREFWSSEWDVSCRC